MKRITLDYDLYERELLTQRKIGAEIVVDLVKKLKVVIDKMQGYSYEQQQQAAQILWKLIHEIEEL